MPSTGFSFVSFVFLHTSHHFRENEGERRKEGGKEGTTRAVKEGRKRGRDKS
jgi:hypothetical protein